MSVYMGLLEAKSQNEWQGYLPGGPQVLRVLRIDVLSRKG